MSPKECRVGDPTSRSSDRTLLERIGHAPFVLLAFFFLGQRATGDGRSIVPPDAAARRYQEGRDAIKRRDFAKGIRDLSECLAMGYTSPAEHLGLSRSFVQRYDPDYWLGVGYMESGDETQARAHLTRSREGLLIEGWPEFSDLTLRLSTLDQRDARRAAAAREARLAAAIPDPQPTPSASLAAPAPTSIPIVASRPATASPPPTIPPPAVETAPVLSGSAQTLSEAQSSLIRKAITALSSGKWSGAESAIRQLRNTKPDLEQTELLDAVLCGTRYLFEGRKDASLLDRARKSLSNYKKRGGNRRTEAYWISPSLEALFGS